VNAGMIHPGNHRWEKGTYGVRNSGGGAEGYCPEDWLHER
jgi:hypothetical protein